MAREKTFSVPSQLGPCTGLTRIGSGAMGAVFRAHHTQMAIDVAVKVLHPRVGKDDPVAVKRFVREVRLLATIRDPHVVGIIDAGQDGKFTYAVMELIRGQSLETILRDEPEGRLSPGAAAYYLMNVALGLATVHQCGVVHRDIKPENIMVTSEGVTKIADFGLARGEQSANLTLANQVVGTPEYMAPELVAQDDVDGRADLYSLGIMAYELLSGKTPFHKGTLLQIIQQHLDKEPIPLNVKNPNVPPGLEAVINKLLAKDPQQRYANAAEAANALSPFADREPPHRPASAADQVGVTAGARSKSLLPSFADLFLARLLAQHGVYPLETLIEGFLALLRLPTPPTFAEFLVQRAGLPPETAQRASTAAEQGLTALRNRIGYAALQQAKRMTPDQLAQATQELQPGMRLEAYLPLKGYLSAEAAAWLVQQMDQGLERGAQVSVQRACQQAGIAPAPLDKLRDTLPPDRFLPLYKLVLKTMVQQF